LALVVGLSPPEIHYKSETTMRKNYSILAVCVASGLFCGIAGATLADDITPTSANGRQTAEFDSVDASRIDAAGQLSRTAESSAARTQSRSPQENGRNQIQPAQSFVRRADATPQGAGNDRVVTQANTSARGLDVSWTFKVSRISALGDTKRQAGSFARSVTVEPEPSEENTLRQGPFKPRAIN